MKNVIYAFAIAIVAIFGTVVVMEHKQVSLAQAVPTQHIPIEVAGSVSVIRQDGGYYSNLPIQTTSDLTAATVYASTVSASTTVASSTTLTNLSVANATTTSALTVGSSGTPLSKVISGSCVAIPTAATIPSYSSIPAYCAVTGAASGDRVQVSIGETGTSTFSTPVFAIGGQATSSNLIQFRFVNASTTATSSYEYATRTLNYIITR